jgi:hypothetical protein
MNSTWKAVIGVILVFILGWFGGALTTLVIAHQRMLAAVDQKPGPLAVMLERQTTRGLGLDEDKKQQMHTLLVDYLQQRFALQKQVQPQIQALNGETLKQIDALLTPTQQQQFRDNLVRIKQRFGRNPFNVGADDKPANSATTAPNPPANSQ